MLWKQVKKKNERKGEERDRKKGHDVEQQIKKKRI